MTSKAPPSTVGAGKDTPKARQAAPINTPKPIPITFFVIALRS